MNATNKLNMKSKALYIRVSTEAQAEEGFSIQAQTERLIAYCKAMGWENQYETYIDGGFSGSNVNRPGMQKLINDVKNHKVTNVIVFKLDRLSRSQKDTLYLIEDVFMPNNVDFISLNESIDTSTPYGRAMIGILSAFAQLERENIFLRTRMGMVERVKQGYWMGGGRVPFGYDYDKNLGIIVPNENAQKVKQIYDLYIKGDSAKKIATILGLKYDKLVIQILKRKSNTGVILYNGVEYKGLHQAIISEEIFNLAMKKLKERSKTRVTNKYYLLTGVIFCGHCLAKMRYQKWGNDMKIVCYSKDSSKSHMVRDKNCSSKAILSKDIEQIVIKDLFQISANINDISNLERNLIVNPIEELQKQIEKTSLKLKKLYNIYADSEDEILFDTIIENKKLLANLKKEFETEQKQNVNNKNFEIVKEKICSISKMWKYMTNQERQAVIRDCIDKIIIENDKVQIYYKFLKTSISKNVA